MTGLDEVEGAYVVGDDVAGVTKINFYVTTKCKYECRYCVLYDNTIEHPTFDKDGWTKLLANFANVEIHMYGGEPFESDEIYDIIKFFNTQKNISSCNVLTNGSEIDVEKLQGLRVNILLSYHPETVKFSVFCEMIEYLGPFVTRLSYMFTGHTKTKLTEYKIFKKLYKHRIDILFCPIMEDNVGKSKSIDMVQLTPNLIKELADDKEYYFRYDKNGISTFDMWVRHRFWGYKQTPDAQALIDVFCPVKTLSTLERTLKSNSVPLNYYDYKQFLNVLDIFKLQGRREDYTYDNCIKIIEGIFEKREVLVKVDVLDQINKIDMIKWKKEIKNCTGLCVACSFCDDIISNYNTGFEL
jgi:hypothetical protein